MQKTLTCGTCGEKSQVNVPDDGVASAWECTNFECGARNEIDGTPPKHETIVAPGERDDNEPVTGWVETVTDTDIGSSGDKAR